MSKEHAQEMADKYINVCALLAIDSTWSENIPEEIYIRHSREITEGGGDDFFNCVKKVGGEVVDIFMIESNIEGKEKAVLEKAKRMAEERKCQVVIRFVPEDPDIQAHIVLLRRERTTRTLLLYDIWDYEDGTRFGPVEVGQGKGQLSAERFFQVSAERFFQAGYKYCRQEGTQLEETQIILFKPPNPHQIDSLD